MAEELLHAARRRGRFTHIDEHFGRFGSAERCLEHGRGDNVHRFAAAAEP